MIKVAIFPLLSGMPFLFPWVYEQGLERLRKIFQLQPIEFPTAVKAQNIYLKTPKLERMMSIMHLQTLQSKVLSKQ